MNIINLYLSSYKLIIVHEHRTSQVPVAIPMLWIEPSFSYHPKARDRRWMKQVGRDERDEGPGSNSISSFYSASHKPGFLFSINYTKDQSKDIYGSTGSKGLYFWIWDLKGEALKSPYYWVFIFHILKGTILIYFHSEPLELWIRGVFFEPWVRSRLFEVSPQSDIISYN